MTPVLTPHAMLDTVKAELNLKNDAALARLIGLTNSSISRIRSRVNPMSATLLVAIHCEDPERFPISRLKELCLQRPVLDAVQHEAVAA